MPPPFPSPPHTPPPTTPLTWAQIYTRYTTILLIGPTTPKESWIHELALTIHRHPSALLIKFDMPTLTTAFSASVPVFPVVSEFLPDINNLLPMLPIKRGEQIERRVLIQLIIDAAGELGCYWVVGARERAAVVVGVMHAVVLEKRERDAEELGALLGGMELGRDEEAILDRLAGELEGGLRIGN